ncbi:MAG: ABC-type lipoprotein release transport system permease subunit [Bradymonadia bacterium]|jgi:ABC-type lipoprotein release transport system permease subunit
MLVFTGAWIDAFSSKMVRAGTDVEIGQLQIRTEAYDDRASIYRSFELGQLVEDVGALDGVSAVTPRIYAYGLVGNEERSQVARMFGVWPDSERHATLLDDAIVEGRWLSDEAAPPGPRECVLGDHLAEQLGVTVGDELVVFLQAADGSLGNDLMEIVGIVHTSTTSVDRTAVIVHHEDLAYVAALDGVAHEIVVAVDDLESVNEVRDAGAAMLGDIEDGPRIQTWEHTMADLANMLKASDSSTWITYLIIYAVAILGLVNAQRMSALERRREFGVLMAIGLKPRQAAWMVIVESVVLTAVGAAAGVLLGGALCLYFQIEGFDMAAMAGGGELSMMGVGFGDRLYFDTSLQSLLEPAWVILVAAGLCGVIPARVVLKTDPVSAIAGRT